MNLWGRLWLATSIHVNLHSIDFKHFRAPLTYAHFIKIEFNNFKHETSKWAIKLKWVQQKIFLGQLTIFKHHKLRQDLHCHSICNDIFGISNIADLFVSASVPPRPPALITGCHLPHDMVSGCISTWVHFVPMLPYGDVKCIIYLYWYLNKLMQGLFASCIYVGSGDPVRALCLLLNKYTGYNWSIYCWDICTTCRYQSYVLLY